MDLVARLSMQQVWELQRTGGSVEIMLAPAL